MTVGTNTTTLTHDITVTARQWTEKAPAIPLGRSGVGILPAQPRVPADLGRTDSNAAINIARLVVDFGPNEGFQLLANEPVTWEVKAFSSEALYDSTHPFFRAHNRSGTPVARVTLADLQKDVEAHEGIVSVPASAPANFKSHWQAGLDLLNVAANRINIPRENDVTHTSVETRQAFIARVEGIVTAGANAVSAATAPHPPRISTGTIYFNYPFISPRSLQLRVNDPAKALTLFNPAGSPTWTATPTGIVTVTPKPTGADVTPVAAGTTTVRVKNADGEIDEISVTVTT